jgi:hypothetical protein
MRIYFTFFLSVFFFSGSSLAEPLYSCNINCNNGTSCSLSSNNSVSCICDGEGNASCVAAESLGEESQDDNSGGTLVHKFKHKRNIKR